MKEKQSQQMKRRQRAEKLEKRRDVFRLLLEFKNSRLVKVGERCVKESSNTF